MPLEAPAGTVRHELLLASTVKSQTTTSAS